MDVHNIRILFAFFALQGREIVVLLYAFPEKSKSTKNNPKSYSYAIEKAKERIEELKSVYEDLQLITNWEIDVIDYKSRANGYNITKIVCQE